MLERAYKKPLFPGFETSTYLNGHIKQNKDSKSSKTSDQKKNNRYYTYKPPTVNDLVNAGIKKAKRAQTVEKPILYDGCAYKRKWPTSWGSQLKVKYCPDFGNVVSVKRVMTPEDRK